MICPDCGHSNRKGAQFCGVCGATLPLAPVQVFSPPPPPVLPVSTSVPLAYLVEAQGTRHPLSNPDTVIGRDPACDVVLNDKRVSSRHATISTDGHTYTVHDRGSTNGTWVNGMRLAGPCPLETGDQLLIGNVTLTFQVGSSALVNAGGGTQAIAESELQALLDPQTPDVLHTISDPATLHLPIRGEVITTPREWQDHPPRDMGRLLVRITVSLFFFGLFLGFIILALSLGLVLICFGAAGLLFLIPFLLLPFQQLYAALMRWLRDDRPVVIVNFQVRDESSGVPVDVRMIRKRGTAGTVNLGDRVEIDGDLEGAAVQATRVHIYESQGMATAIDIPLCKPWPVAVGIAFIVGLLILLLFSLLGLGLLG